ncbi:MAG: aspartate aminotransferase family protein [Pseudomonadales bacterium]
MTATNWPFTGGRAIAIASAEGSELLTTDGQRILDAAGGAIVSNIGHGRERVAQAIYQATRDCTYVVPPWVTPGRQALVEQLQQHWLPAHLNRIHIASGGSEAVESGLKIALQYHAARGETQRTKIISREVSYHGTTITTATLSGHPARKRGLSQALTENPKTLTPYPLRSPLGMNHPDSARYYADALAATIEAEGPNNIAAFLAEPITGSSGGALVPPDGYWPMVRELCDEHGILLVLDEVMTGFGRTGRKFGYQHFGIEPDILVAGKGLAGGYAPIGGIFAAQPIGDAIRAAGYSVMFHTFGAHPAACAGAAEVLQILVEEDLVSRAAYLGERLQSRLQDLFANHAHVAQVRGLGLLQAIEVVADRNTLAPFPERAQIGSRIIAKGLERGVFYYGGGTGAVRDIVCLGPAFTTSEAQIETMAVTLKEAVDAALADAP